MQNKYFLVFLLDSGHFYWTTTTLILTQVMRNFYCRTRAKTFLLFDLNKPNILLILTLLKLCVSWLQCKKKMFVYFCNEEEKFKNYIQLYSNYNGRITCLNFAHS
jgi:hypothetical protein